MSNTKNTNNANTSGTDVNQEKIKPTLDEDYGYNFFPDRDPSSPVLKPDDSLFGSLKHFWKKGGRSKLLQRKCEMNILWCTQNHPLVRLMMRALKSHGCAVDLDRHFSCEPCDRKVNGGYDPISNQVVVCQNVTKKRDYVCSVLSHELTHAFDQCRANMDFTNFEHLACSEIRASNFSHCSFSTVVANGEARLWDYEKAHQTCVKNKAMQSVVVARNVSIEKAMEIVDKVFDRCYYDLEPVGRIPRKCTRDADLALIEGELYGYTD